MAKSIDEGLAKLRDKLAEASEGSSGHGFWSPDDGQNLIRVFPKLGEMDFFFMEVGQHRLPDGTYVKCPRITTEGEYDCPICEYVRSLYASGKPKAKKLAQSIQGRKNFWMNIVVRDFNKDEGGTTGDGPLLYTPGVTVIRGISAIVSNPDYGDVTDVDKGFDLILNYTKNADPQNRYNVQARRNPSPLHVEEDVMEQWLEDALEINWVMLTDDPDEDEEVGQDILIKLLPYDRMVEEYGISANGPVDGADLEAELDEDPFPVKAKVEKVKEEPEEEESEVGAAISESRKRLRQQRRHKS